jgi:hypothetical protein
MLKQTRIAVATILFALSALLVVFAVGWSSSFEHCVAEARQQEGAEQQKEGATHFFRVVVNHLHSTWRCTGHFIDENEGAITATFTVILGIATILLWYATSGLVHSAERSRWVKKLKR